MLTHLNSQQRHLDRQDPSVRCTRQLRPSPRDYWSPLRRQCQRRAELPSVHQPRHYWLRQRRPVWHSCHCLLQGHRPRYPHQHLPDHLELHHPRPGSLERREEEARKGAKGVRRIDDDGNEDDLGGFEAIRCCIFVLYTENLSRSLRKVPLHYMTIARLYIGRILLLT